MAMMNDGLPIVLCACCLIMAGCGETHMGRREKLERAVAAASLATASGRQSAVEHGAEIVRLVQETPPNDRAKALEDLTGIFLRMDFDESSYSSREESMTAYNRLVSSVADGLRETAEVEEAVWGFRLAAVNRVNAEIERCEREPKGGPYGDLSKMGFGPCMLQRQYLSRLKSKRFDMIRDGFEMLWFPKYFNALSALEQAKWKSRIEKVAHRPVLIWNPDDPFAERPFYEEEDTREWLPQKSPDEPRKYVEHLGGGKTAIVFETRWGMESRKRREEQRRQRDARKAVE